MEELATRKEVLETLNISHNTIYKMIKRGEIEAVKIGRVYRYDLKKFLADRNFSSVNQRKICYCRVSSRGQKDDLMRQVKVMEELYPSHEIIKDIGSGLNFKRKGILKLINSAFKGEIAEIVITFKDRLCRFGFDLLESIVRIYSHGKIIILNRKEEKTPMEEITEDILSIMNVYVAKINGMRNHKNKIEKDLKSGKICHRK